MSNQYQGDRGLPVHEQMQRINGSPQYLGTIQSTGTNVISNLSSSIQKGYRLLLQPDAAGYVLGADNSTTPSTINSSTTGVKLSADEKFYLTLQADGKPGNSQLGQGYLQWISASGTSKLKVWRLV